MKQYKLEDIYRKPYPNKRTFTFFRGNSRSRIDYFLTSTILDTYINDTSVVHFPFSDHDAIVLQMDLVKSLNGPGIWKMNSNTIPNRHIPRITGKKYGRFGSVGLMIMITS